MIILIIVLLLCAGCGSQKPQLPAIDTKGFEPAIVAQIDTAISRVRADPQSGAAWGKLGMVLHAYELYSPAHDCYHHATALDPKNPQWTSLHDALERGVTPSDVTILRIGLKAWSEQAEQLLLKARHAEAALIIERLIKDYSNAPEPWLLFGRWRLEQNDCAGAEKALRRMLQISPESVNAHFQLGITLICLERYAEAVPILQRAVQIKPDFGEAHFNLGFALARSGSGHAAIPSFRKAIRYNPDMIDPYITLADLLSQTGEIQEATNLLTRALLLDPADERAKNLLRRLQP
jgi:tetratricopeptide (TPR) repeat protein